MLPSLPSKEVNVETLYFTMFVASSKTNRSVKKRSIRSQGSKEKAESCVETTISELRDWSPPVQIEGIRTDTKARATS